MSLQAFGTRGLTANLAANATASSAVQVSSTPTGQYNYQLVNTGSNTIYFASGVLPTLTVTIPLPGTPANGVPILPNEIVVYNLQPNAYFSVICEAGKTSNLLVTCGEGM